MVSFAQIRKDVHQKKHKNKKYAKSKHYYNNKKPIDSFQIKRNHVRDSLADIKKYRESRHYRDSVSKSLAKKAEDLKTGRARALVKMDLTGLSKADSIAVMRQYKSDSMAAVRKYHETKRYRDSTTLARRERTDSVKRAQIHRRDSIASKRKHAMDSAKLVRKHTMDSIKTVRTRHMDSLKLARKFKTDSLGKVKAEKEKLAKAKEKKKQEDKKLKLEIKFNQKREAWSNQTMLKKRWSRWRNIIQNTFTHYNYYFNARKRMNETLANLQKNKKENYDSLITLYPFDPRKDTGIVKKDMDTIMRKVSVGLQIHDPRVKWANDMYLLLGEANYYKGNYKNAITTFRYIIAKDEAEKKKQYASQSHYGEKSKTEPTIAEDEQKSGLAAAFGHKSVHNDAVLWLARSYTSAHSVENSESVISLLESDTHLPDDMKGKVAREKAFAFLEDRNYSSAIPQLEIVENDNNQSDHQRMRAAYLRGQLLEMQGQYGNAVASFNDVLDYHPKLEMDFYTRKHIAYSSLLAGDDAATAMKPLKKIIKDAKYSSYYDQVYYVLGKLAMKAGKTDDGVTYLNKSINTPKATKKQKAMSFAALGDAYYNNGQYMMSKASYDSASKYAIGLKDTAGLANIGRAKTLTDIVAPATVIHDQDSLLSLAELSQREQLSAVRRYLKYLQKMRDDSIAGAELAAAAANPVPDVPVETSDYSSWYFSNPTQVQLGSQEFKKKWGNRPLTDNWRRSSAQSATSSNNEEVVETDEDDNSSTKGLPSEKYLLAKIPNTTEQKIQAGRTEQKAYIQLAKAYFTLFDDYTNAIATLDKLDSKFPDHNQREEELYLRYQIALKQNQLDKAQGYAKQLIDEFPDSEYAKMLKPKDSKKSEAGLATQEVSKYYDETYNLLMTHQYTMALGKIEAGMKMYDNPLFKKRFMVSEAQAYAGMGDLDKADTVIATFLKTYHPPDTLVDWALTIKNYIADVRKHGGIPSWYTPPPPGSQPPATAADSAAMASIRDSLKKALPPGPKPDSAQKPPVPAMYQNTPDAEHYCIVSLPALNLRVTNLRKKVISFDSSYKAAGGLEIILDYYDADKTVMVIKKFTNAAEAKSYMAALAASNVFSDFNSSEFLPMIIAAPNYVKLFADKKIDAYQSFYNAVYK